MTLMKSGLAQTSACVSPVQFKKLSLFSPWQTNVHDVVKASTQLWKLALASAFSKHSHLSLIIHSRELSILVSVNPAYKHQTFFRKCCQKNICNTRDVCVTSKIISIYLSKKMIFQICLSFMYVWTTETA